MSNICSKLRNEGNEADTSKPPLACVSLVADSANFPPSMEDKQPKLSKLAATPQVGPARLGAGTDRPSGPGESGLLGVSL